MRYRNRRLLVLGAGALLAVVAVLSSCRVEETPTTPYPGPLAGLTHQPTARMSAPAATVYPAPMVKTPVPPTARPTAPATLPPPSPTAPALSPAPTGGEVAFTLTLLHTGEAQGEVLPCG